MPYKTIFKIEDDILVVELEGERNMKDSIDYWNKIAEICGEKEIKKVLVIVKLTGKLQVMNAFSIGEMIVEKLKKCANKIAIADISKDAFENNRLAAIVAANRGINSQIFKEEEEARRWLELD